jgi:hypothetical protein
MGNASWWPTLPVDAKITGSACGWSKIGSPNSVGGAGTEATNLYGWEVYRLITRSGSTEESLIRAEITTQTEFVVFLRHLATGGMGEVDEAW